MTDGIGGIGFGAMMMVFSHREPLETLATITMVVVVVGAVVALIGAVGVLVGRDGARAASVPSDVGTPV